MSILRRIENWDIEMHNVHGIWFPFVEMVVMIGLVVVVVGISWLIWVK